MLTNVDPAYDSNQNRNTSELTKSSMDTSVPVQESNAGAKFDQQPQTTSAQTKYMH